MMPTRTLLRCIDAFINQAQPNINTGDRRVMRLKATGSSDERQSFIWFRMPFDLKELVNADNVILSAILTLRTASVWGGGSETITAKRIIEAWVEDTITWNDDPAVGSGSAVSAVVSGNGTLVTIDVTALVAEAVSNKKWYGLRLTTNATTLRDLHASETMTEDYQPKLEVTWTRKPKPPRDLSPSGARAFTTSTPTLTWNFLGDDGESQQDQYRVLVDNDVNFGSPTWDSGWISSQQESAVVGAALSADTTYFWKVACRDEQGRESDFSDVAEIIRRTKGSLTISNPPAPAGNFVEETSPPILWALASRTQRAYRIFLYRLVDAEYIKIHDSGRIAGAGTSYTIPEKDSDSRDRLIRKEGANEYRVTVRVWDTIDREATPGDPTYTELSRDFDFRQSTTPTAPTGLTAAQYNAHAVKLDWSRTTAPDFWAIIVDGERVRNRLTSAETTEGGTDYGWVYRGAEPLKDHTYEVEAVVLSSGVLKHSDSPPSAVFRLEPTGIWLMDEDFDTPVRLTGVVVPRFDIGSSETLMTLPGSKKPVLIRQMIRGWEGVVTGEIHGTDNPNLEAKDYLDNLYRLKRKNVASDARLLIAANRVNIPVILGKITVGPLPHPTKDFGGSGFEISVEVAQVGKFPV